MANRPAKAKANQKAAKAAHKGDDFVSVAKRLECDDDKASFEAKLGKLAKAKPRPK